MFDREKKRVTAAKSLTPLLIIAISKVVEFVSEMIGTTTEPAQSFIIATSIYSGILGIIKFIKR